VASMKLMDGNLSLGTMFA